MPVGAIIQVGKLLDIFRTITDFKFGIEAPLLVHIEGSPFEQGGSDITYTGDAIWADPFEPDTFGNSGGDDWPIHWIGAVDVQATVDANGVDEDGEVFALTFDVVATHGAPATFMTASLALDPDADPPWPPEVPPPVGDPSFVNYEHPDATSWSWTIRLVLAGGLYHLTAEVH